MNWADSPADMLAAAPNPPLADKADHVAAARELLARTAELPDGRRDLLVVLSEYRAAVYAFAVESGQP